MEQTKFVNLPIIGRVQHGEQIKNANGGRKVVEYGHFIAKVQDDYMQTFLERFNELYKGKKSLDIELLEEPFTMKYARYNQGGEACHCMVDSDTANFKSQNGWKNIKCDKYNCQYRQKNEQGKMACNRIGWLKFLIPSICTDRIWLMRITGQTSLDRLNDYFQLQKLRGMPLKGHYTLFLKQEEQSNFMGKTFNNYILDILKKEDFISEKQIPQTTEKPKALSTTNVNNVNNQVEKETKTETKIETKTQTPAQVQTQTSKKVEQINTAVEMPKEKNTKKATKTTTKKKETKTSEKTNIENKSTETKQDEDTDFKNCYVLETTYKEKIADKAGQEKEYLIGRFYNMDDKQFNVAIKPSDEEELQKCDLGTYVRLALQEVRGKLFALNLEYIDKRLKNIAA